MAGEDAGVRDNLALERTVLANERTLLAYVRTALSLVAGGAVLLQFFAGIPAVIVSGWSLVGLGVVVMGVGVGRFLSVRRRLRGNNS